MQNNKLFHTAHSKAYHIAHLGERPAHMVYFSLVAWESHGVYGIAAAACFILMLLSAGPSPE